MKRQLFFFFLGLVIVYLFFLTPLSLAKETVTYRGQLNLSDQSFHLNIDQTNQGSLMMTSKHLDGDQYQFAINVDHWKIFDYDLSTKINGSFQLPSKTDDPQFITTGQIKSQYSLVNYKPFEDMSGEFKLTKDRLQLTSFIMRRAQGEGYVDLNPPYDINVNFQLNNMDMDDFLSLWMRKKEFRSDGLVQGDIKVSGQLDRIFLEGDLQSHDGFVRNLAFNKIDLNLKGFYPQMQISESLISKSDGAIFGLEGPFDLKEKDFKKQLKKLTFTPLVKDSGTEVELIIKQLTQPKDSGTVSLKAVIQKEDDDSFKQEEHRSMVGIERTMNF